MAGCTRLLKTLSPLLALSLTNCEKPLTCPAGLQEQCSALQQEAEMLRQKIQEADHEHARHFDKDFAEPDGLVPDRLRLNYVSSLLQLYTSGEEPEKIETTANDFLTRYESMSRLWEKDASEVKKMRPYTEREELAVAKVVQDFGPLYVKPSDADAQGHPVPTDVTAETTPWSGYWYPKQKTETFEGDGSPLAKFDQAAVAAGRHALAVKWEQEHRDPYATYWEGLCDAWAMASMLTKEPVKPLVYKGVTFAVSDLKALLIKSYEGFKPKIYGLRYLGTAETDGEMQDIRPEAFHRIVEVVIGQQKRPFLIDDDPGPQVWSKPLFRMRWVMAKDPEIPNALLITAWPRLTNNRMHVSNDVTTVYDVKAPQYSYRLYFDPAVANAEGKFLVRQGEWVGRTVEEHPDFVMIPDSQTKPTPKNVGLSQNLDLINLILSEGTPVP